MTTGENTSKWANLKKIFETQGAIAAFTHLTSGSEGGHTEAKEDKDSVQSWASKIAPQTDFSCGFFTSSPKKEKEHVQSCPSEVYSRNDAIDVAQMPNRRLKLNTDFVEVEEMPALKANILEVSQIDDRPAVRGLNECSIDEPEGDNSVFDQDVTPFTNNDDGPAERIHPAMFPNSVGGVLLEDVLSSLSTSDKTAEIARLSHLHDAEQNEAIFTGPLRGASSDDASAFKEETENRLGEPPESSIEQPSAQEQVSHADEIPDLVQRGQKPTAAHDWMRIDHQKAYDPALLQLHTDLLPAVGTMQVVACMDASQELHLDKPVWLVSADGDVSLVDADDCDPWIWNFTTEGFELSVLCRSGRGECCINQDNYSIAHAPGDRSVFTVCDGHGPHGSLVAFRVAQCLPKLILEGIFQKPHEAVENIVAVAFRSANVNLHSFASKHGIDCSCSGVSCSLVVRQGSHVHVAWLGDSRALVASVTADRCSQVNLFSPVHSIGEEAEQDRLVSKGSELHLSNHGDSLRVAAPNQGGQPGLTISRAFGDYMMMPHGLLSQPDLVKTNFVDVPGLVLLASGGACEFQDDGEVILERLIDEGRLLEEGVHYALSRFCNDAQSAWLESNNNAFCDDVTALLLYWRTPARELRGIASTAVEGSVGSVGAYACREEQAPSHRQLAENLRPVSSMPVAVDRSACSQQQRVKIFAKEVVVPDTDQIPPPLCAGQVAGIQKEKKDVLSASVEGPMVVRRDNSLHSHPGSDARVSSGLQSGGRSATAPMPEGPRFQSMHKRS